jgi:hypothetical protein
MILAPTARLKSETSKTGFLTVSNRFRFPCTFEKACHTLWAVHVMGWSQTQAAILIELNVGTVCHVVHRRRFPTAYPVQMPGFGAA